METRVKERLIGALILIALIVLLVPELLTGPHEERGSGTRDGGAVQTYTIDLTAPASQTAPAASRIQQAPPEPAAAPTDQPTETVSVEAVPEPASAQPAPAKATTQKPPAAVSTASSASGAAESAWAVQLGSFASEANAQRLANELKARGYKAFVSRIDSGSRTRYRVRVGPEQERARAENLAARLRRDGHSAVIVPQP
jgi:DedD protein